MRITDSNLQLSSSHASVERHEKHEHLTYWKEGGDARRVDGQVPQGRGVRRLVAEFQAEMRSVEVRISDQATALQPKQALLGLEGADEEDGLMADMEVSLLKTLVEHMTGRKLKILRPGDFQPDKPAHAEGRHPEKADGEAAEREGWGLVYDYYESHYEAESGNFSAEGVVRTADGKEIHIDVELNMSREFFSEESLSIRAGDALKDPLVIDFNGTGAQLTQTKFSFDLDRDGRQEQMSFVRPGSGFLALDKNADGTINDGGELFGPASGDGFSELAAHDADNNNWIDENDPVYEQLRIWSKDAQGNDHLVGLGQRGVGAIYLGRAETPFELKDADNELHGQVRSSGIFLEEDSGVGLVQQVDLKV